MKRHILATVALALATLAHAQVPVVDTTNYSTMDKDTAEAMRGLARDAFRGLKAVVLNPHIRNEALENYVAKELNDAGLATSTIKGAMRNVEAGQEYVTLEFRVEIVGKNLFVEARLYEMGTIKRTGRVTDAAESFFAEWHFEQEEGVSAADQVRFAIRRLAGLYRENNRRE